MPLRSRIGAPPRRPRQRINRRRCRSRHPRTGSVGRGTAAVAFDEANPLRWATWWSAARATSAATTQRAKPCSQDWRSPGVKAIIYPGSTQSRPRSQHATSPHALSARDEGQGDRRRDGRNAAVLAPGWRRGGPRTQRLASRRCPSAVADGDARLPGGRAQETAGQVASRSRGLSRKPTDPRGHRAVDPMATCRLGRRVWRAFSTGAARCRASRDRRPDGQGQDDPRGPQGPT